jgi:S-DNA-T family DNA segregation ATPase FtsK/SpoIIIE
LPEVKDTLETVPKTVVPLPSVEPTPQPSSNIEEVATVSVPLPSESVELPTVKAEVVPEEPINVESEKQVARATQNAFAGAFDIELGSDDQPSDTEAVLAEENPVSDPVIETESSPEPKPEIGEEAPETEEEFVSAAEQFIAADEDNSGALSVEELAHATGSTLEEATELHAEADTDGDGVVTLSEFISSPASERSASMPKPIAPVRKPLAANQQPTPTSPPEVRQRPQPLPQQNWQQPQQQPAPQQNWQQPQQQRPPQQNWQQPQQGWQQPQAPVVQPTIRSGVHCRSCGIGLDPYWRFCPVCGQQNVGY